MESAISKELKTGTALFVRFQRCILLSNDIPRRLKRFQRKKQPAPGGDGEIDFGDAVQVGNTEIGKLEKKKELNKQITMQLALGEVEKFKKRHKRLPKKKEYDKIAESIYKQLKDDDRRKKLLERPDKKRKKKAKKGRPGKGGGKQSKLKADAFAQLKNAAQGLDSKGAAAKEMEGMSVEDLFGKETKGKKAVSGDEFSLDGISGLDSAAGEDSKAAEKGGCPNCGNQTEDVIFCPECGTAFCEKCAKKIEKTGKATKVTCPKCKKRVNH